MAKKRYYDGMYAGYDARKAQEKSDGGMIKEDMGAFANLPQGVVMKYYSNPGSGVKYPYLDDTIKGVDMQMRDDSKGGKSKKNPEKY